MSWSLTNDTITKTEISKLASFIKTAEKLTYGDKTLEFENKFSKWNNSKYSVMVNSGSSANLIMAIALKKYLKKEKIRIGISSLTWSTSVTPFSLLGYEVYFYDSQLSNLGINRNDLISSIKNKKVDAILITHILGFPSVDKEIISLAKKNNIVILEDCCEALGAKVSQKKVGNFGMMSSFSFFYSHHMSTIEGGMICTNNKFIYELSKLIRSHGLSRELDNSQKETHWKKRFYFIEEGLNLRPTELNAYLGILQLEKMNKMIEKRNHNLKYYLENLPSGYYNNFKLDGVSNFSLPLIAKNKVIFKDTLNKLDKLKVEYRPLIAGNLLNHPLASKIKYKKLSKNFKNSELIDKCGIYLGNGSHVNKSIINNLFSELNKIK